MAIWQYGALVLSGGLAVTLVEWMRGRKRDRADATELITRAAAQAVEMSRLDNDELRVELRAARSEIVGLQVKLIALTADFNHLQGTVSTLEHERSQLLEALARWSPPIETEN